MDQTSVKLLACSRTLKLGHDIAIADTIRITRRFTSSDYRPEQQVAEGRRIADHFG